MPSQTYKNTRMFAQAIGPETFPLSKFSFATVSSESTAPLPWKHIPDNGALFAVFDTGRLHQSDGVIEEYSELKIVHGAERLVLMHRFCRSCELIPYGRIA